MKSEILKETAYKAVMKMIHVLLDDNDLRVMPVYDTKEFLLMPQKTWGLLEDKIREYDQASEVIGLDEPIWTRAFILVEVCINKQNDKDTMTVPFIADTGMFKKILAAFIPDADYILLKIADEPSTTYRHDPFKNLVPRYIEINDFNTWKELFPNNWL